MSHVNPPPAENSIAPALFLRRAPSLPLNSFFLRACVRNCGLGRADLPEPRDGSPGAARSEGNTWGERNKRKRVKNAPSVPFFFLLLRSQNVNFAASCNWRGSPTPWRRKPSKLNSPGVVSGLIRFLLLKVLNISMVGMIE